MVNRIVKRVKGSIVGMSPFTDNSIDSNVLTMRQSLWKFGRQRDDLTIDECSQYLSCRWEHVQERSKIALVLQLCDLLTIRTKIGIDAFANTAAFQKEISLRECYATLMEQDASVEQRSEQSIVLQIYNLLIARSPLMNSVTCSKLPPLPGDAFDDVILDICSSE